MKKLLLLLFMVPFIAQAQAWQWGRQSGDNFAGDYSYAADIDVHGNVFITGFFENTFIVFGTDTLQNAAGNDDVYLVKYDAMGNVLWARSPLSNGNAGANGESTDTAGNVYIAGSFSSNGVPGKLIFGTDTLTAGTGTNYETDLFVAKYDGAGNVLWAKTALATDTSYVTASGAKTDRAGNVYVTGFFQSKMLVFGNDTLLNASDTGYDAFLVKYDATGNVVWAKQSSNGNLNNYGGLVTTDAAGNVYWAGNNPGPGLVIGTHSFLDTGIYIVKYNPAGNMLRAIGIANTNASVSGIAIDASGNLILCGSFTDTFIIHTDTLIDVTPVGPPGYVNSFVVKTDSTGAAVWAKKMLGYNSARTVTVDAAGSVYVLGYFDECWLGNYMVAGNDTLHTAGGYDTYLVKYSNSGNALWAASAGGTGDDWPGGLAVDSTGNDIYVSGYFNSPSMMISGDALYANGQRDIYVARFNPLMTVGVGSLNGAGKNISVYPNPATTMLHVAAAEEIKNITVTNLIGQEVTNVQPLSQPREVTIDVTTLPSGIYFIKVNGTDVSKFVKE